MRGTERAPETDGLPREMAEPYIGPPQAAVVHHRERSTFWSPIVPVDEMREGTPRA